MLPFRLTRPARRSLLTALLALSALLPVASLGGGGALPVRAAEPTAVQLQSLEAALNGQGDLGAILSEGPGLDPDRVVERRRTLLRQFPDARWQLTPGEKLRDGRSTVMLQVSGSREDGPTTYRLSAEQHLALESDGRRITGQTVIREQSVLRSGEATLPITLLIPDAVLTGQRYDVDVIFDEPLDGAIAAGGIVAVTGDQVQAFDNPDLQLGALGGGGLFKSVQAPFSPGEQTWAVLLVHPDGIVSATKRVRVVADKSQLSL